jgi:beta-1,4-mannosyl-glycoprotein beta-1,4-N-acetylglucosaminyltransferase
LAVGATVIVDCVVFGDELDVLEVRLRLLDDVVDYFVIVEASQTFSGLPKPTYFKDNRARFAPWAHKIVTVDLERLPPPQPTRWLPVTMQQNAILQGLDRIDLAADDVVMFSDVDEIPYRAAIEEAAVRIRAGEDSVSFELQTSRIFGNWVDPSDQILVTKAYRRSFLTSPHHQRMFVSASSVIADAGRHISTLLTPEGVARKLGRVAHFERDNARDGSLTHLERCRRYGVEFLGTAVFDQVVPDDEVLLMLAEVRPDLIATRPLPRRRARERYLAVTRVRSALKPTGRTLAWLDRHAESRAVGSIARGVAPLVRFGRRVRTRPVRHRRAAGRRDYFASVTCTPENLCQVCTGELKPT